MIEGPNIEDIAEQLAQVHFTPLERYADKFIEKQRERMDGPLSEIETAEARGAIAVLKKLKGLSEQTKTILQAKKK